MVWIHLIQEMEQVNFNKIIYKKGLITALSISILNFHPYYRNKPGLGTLLVGLMNKSEKITNGIEQIFDKFVNELNELRNGFYFKNNNGFILF